MKPWVKIALFFLLTVPLSSTAAEIGYVSESLKIGLHENASLQSTILYLVPSGTELEIIDRSGEDRVKVKTTDGLVGWMDARYLKPGVTPSRRVQELEDELLQTATELAKARDQAAELEFQLSKARARAAALEASINTNGPANSSQQTGGGSTTALSSETLRELQHVAEENQSLKQRVAELEAVQNMAVERPAGAVDEPSNPHPKPAAENGGGSALSHYTAVFYWDAWKQILLLSIILLAFGAGGYLVDWEVRRRHGGFRV